MIILIQIALLKYQISTLLSISISGAFQGITSPQNNFTIQFNLPQQ